VAYNKEKNMGAPKKHAEIIKAWADGADLQVRGSDGQWDDVVWPGWGNNLEYRIKPEEPALRLAAATVEAIAAYYCLMPATVEAVSARVLHDAAELQLVVPMAEVQEVAREMTKRLRGKRELAVAESVQSAAERIACRNSDGMAIYNEINGLDLPAIIATVKD
jgi:hypothetical protein